MARLLGTVEALLPPSRRMIIIAGPAAEFIPFPPRATLLATGPDIAYLISASGMLHDAAVTLQAWDGEPPGTADAYADIDLTDGTLRISKMLEGDATESVRAGPAGTYRVAVQVTGRDEIRHLDVDPNRPEAPQGIERFIVRFWPTTRPDDTLAFSPDGRWPAGRNDPR
jgi:hypothetical protein